MIILTYDYVGLHSCYNLYLIVFVKELESQGEWVTINVDFQVHKDEVIKVEYMAENNTIVSCSNDPHTTLVIRHVAGRRAPYIFKISRVIKHFVVI